MNLASVGVHMMNIGWVCGFVSGLSIGATAFIFLWISQDVDAIERGE